MAFGRSPSFMVLYSENITLETCHSITKNTNRKNRKFSHIKKLKQNFKNYEEKQSVKNEEWTENKPAQKATKSHAAISTTATEPSASCCFFCASSSRAFLMASENATPTIGITININSKTHKPKMVKHNAGNMHLVSFWIKRFKREVKVREVKQNNNKESKEKTN